MTYSANIQLLRFVAASSVALGHAASVAANYQLTAEHPAVLFASFGVDLFFVISGFIMVYTSAASAGRAGRLRIFSSVGLSASCRFTG